MTKLNELVRLPAQRLVRDSRQPRTVFDEASLLALGQNMKNNGQKVPVRASLTETARHRIGLGETLQQLIDLKEAFPLGTIRGGERRVRAALLVGLDSVDCLLIDGELSEVELIEDQLDENQLHESLSPMDEARAYQAILSKKKITIGQLAAERCVSVARVSKRITLKRLPPDVQDLVHTGALDFSLAYPIARLPGHDRMRELAKQAIGPPPMTKAMVEAVVDQELNGTARKKTTKLRLTFEVDVAAGYDALRQISASLNSKVQQLEKAGVKPANGVGMICRKEV